MTRRKIRSFPFTGSGEDWLERLRAAGSVPELGRLGRYEVAGEVGRGGQGVVYRARDPEAGTAVALKLLRGGRLASDESQARFDREAAAVLALDHPGIVRVLAVESIEGRAVLVMEWIAGVPITDWARGQDLRRVVQVVIEIAGALHHAHRRGVVHRDIKPSNILVDDAGHPHVLDFGLAAPLDSLSSRSQLTTTGEFLGTLAYAAPEQFHSQDERIDGRTDLYALAVILYEALTASLPYAVEGQLARALRAILFAPPRPLSAQRPDCPSELEAVVQKALAKDPEDRYGTIDAFAQDLTRFLTGEPVRARPPGAWQTLARLARQHRMASGALALVLVLTVGLSITMGMFWSRAEKAQARAERVQSVLRAMLEPPVGGLDLGQLDSEALLESASRRVILELAGEPDLAQPLHTLLAWRFAGLRNWTLMEREARRALELHETLGPPYGEDYVMSLSALGTALAFQGDSTAVDLCRQAVRHNQAQGGGDRMRSASLQALLARALWIACSPPRFAESEVLYQRTLAVLQEVEAPPARHSATTFEDYAKMLVAAGRGEEAVATIQSALSIYDAHPTQWQRDRLHCMESAARMHARLGQLEAAESHYRRAIGERHGALDDRLPPVLSNLGRILFARGLDVEALAHYHEAIATRCERLAELHPTHRQALTPLAATMRSDGLSAANLPAVWRAIESADAAILPLLEITTGRIAAVHGRQGRPEAERQLRDRLEALAAPL